MIRAPGKMQSVRKGRREHESGSQVAILGRVVGACLTETMISELRLEGRAGLSPGDTWARYSWQRE